MTTTIPAVREAAQASFTPIFIALRLFNKIYLEIANNKVKFADTKPHKALFSIAKRLPGHAIGHSRGSGESGDVASGHNRQIHYYYETPSPNSPSSFPRHSNVGGL